ncbi:cationic amino acid transporter, partial [Genlisea aurea]
STSSSWTSSFFSGFFSSAVRSKPLISTPEIPLRSSSGEGLLRRLGLFELVLLGIGASIGAGIFVVTGTVARDTGPGVTLSFIIAGASCVLNALCYAELASRFPAVVGGAYLYSYTAFNELTAFLVFAQLMLDYHIGAASIARSLASYVVSVLELIPFLNNSIPSWVGHGEEVLGALSINLLAPVLLALLTIVLCWGVGESAVLNSIMTTIKVIIVLFVIVVGAFEIDVSNWTPFAPYGFKSILTGATVVFFSYVGFDAVANSAEESKKPQRDLPLGIIASLLVCAALYIGVCLVITGMVPYQYLGEDAPLADAFTARGLKYVSLLISFGAVAGLTTTLLVGLYVQSRLYLGLGRDGLLPPIFSKVHPEHHTPVHSQVWVGIVASILAGLFNVHSLSHILSVGTLTGYSVVCACVVALRWNDKASSNRSSGIVYLCMVAFSGFSTGLLFRFDASIVIQCAAALVAVIFTGGLCLRHTYLEPPGFRSPGVPILPSISIFFNLFLFAQLHYEGWVRFIVVSIISVVVYAIYGQHHADPSQHHSSMLYQRAP